jgi:hypothetical protein
LSVVVWYRYVSSLNSRASGKWGTFVEATLQKPNFLPYITSADGDKLYQSLLFQWCVHPVFSGVNVTFQNELCIVETNDRQTFTITMNPENNSTWSDSAPVTINDVYFTYKSIIKDNYRNIPHLDWYSTLQINVDNNMLKIVFPKASKDNMIFFTNFILPAHILANISLEEYLIRFIQSPVGSTCTRLETVWKDSDNYIFNLSACPDFSLKNYQIKWFKNEESMNATIQANKQFIDFSLNPLPSDLYTENKVLLNSYLTFFFNTERAMRTARQRQWLSLLLKNIYIDKNNITWENKLFEYDPYLFPLEQRASDEEIKKLLLPIPDVKPENNENKPLENNVITLSSPETNKHTYTISQKIEDKRPITINLPNSYERVSITPDGGNEYFPQSYVATKKTFQYNLSETVSTIKAWKNTYTIAWYTRSGEKDTRTITIRYLETPPQPVALPEPITTLNNPFIVVYFEDEITISLIEQFKWYIESLWRSERFVFESYPDASGLEWKLTTKEYDIAFRTVSFWLKKDLSVLFNTDNPIVNPSIRKNEQLSNLVSSYFLTDSQSQKEKIQQQINEIYREDPQIMILGKGYGTVWVKKNNGITYPEKLYVLWWRKWVLQKTQLFQHVAIDREKAKKRSTIRSFIKKEMFWITMPVDSEEKLP